MGRVLLSLALILCTTRLAAAPPTDTEQAKQHYARGTAHYNLREYKEAVIEFEAAYRLAPDPVFLYNLGQCNRLMGNNEEALHFYRSYLRMQPDSPNRAEVEGRIEKLEAEIAAHPKPAAPVTPPSTPPPAIATPSATTSAVAVGATATAAPHERKRPVYKKWWFWTIVGVVAAGAATGLAVGLTSETSPRSYPQVNF